MSKVNPNKPLSHNVDVIRMMSLIEVDLPYNLSLVPAALESVKKELEYYEGQTNVVDWNSMDFAPRERETPSVSTSLISFPESELDSPSPTGSNTPW
uniref:Uncharacterized protein n=1 Tax=Steinernema glaseri TaxID=37863 RepID=A0A1I7Z612_9BILA